VAAAVKCGVGLVEAVAPESVCAAISAKISEVTFHIIPQDKDGFISDEYIDDILKESKKCSAVLIGCGMGWNQRTKNITYELIRNLDIPMIIDADGINVLSENIDILKEVKSGVVITPHLKEMARLISENVGSIAANKARYAKEFSQKHGVTTVLKGNQTAISDPEGNVFINPTGNVGMAKGGSGDVLSGMIGSFLAQGLSPVNAAIYAVFIHGMSGDECKNKFSAVSMTPTDIINELPNIFLQFE
jgi:NAD(P)H-hydrate epimerase